MKNLLDHFRRNPTPPADAPVKTPQPAKPKAAPIEPARLQTNVARAVKPAWHTTATPFAQKQILPASAERATAALPTEMVTLHLGDFLDRIPPELLDEGAHDRSMPMPFELAGLSERIWRGDTTIRVAEVFRRIPDIFRNDRTIDKEREIPFPWKKVLAMMQEAKAGASDAGISRAAVEALASKFQARKLGQPSKAGPTPAVPGAAGAGQAPNAAQSLAPATAADGSGVDAAAAAAMAQELAKLRAERDDAVTRAAEFGVEYDASISRTADLTTERDAAIARAAELTAGHDAAVARAAELAAERDAAVSRMADLTAVRDASAARIGKLVAETAATDARVAELTTAREAAVARAAELTAERDAAVERAAAAARTTELTTERDAAVARTAELTTEREAAVAQAAEAPAEGGADEARLAALTEAREAADARATKIANDLEAALALADEATTERDATATRLAELTAERDAAASRTAELTAERDAAIARTAELTAERDAVVKSAAEYLEAGRTAAASDSTPEQKAWETRVVAQFETDIEGFRNTIQALLHERDDLRRRLDPAAAGPAPGVVVNLSSPAADAQPDVYSSLFPTCNWAPRVGALVLTVLGLAILMQFPHGTVTPPHTARSTASALPAGPERQTPQLTDAILPETKFALEVKPPVETMTLVPADPLLGSTAELH